MTPKQEKFAQIYVETGNANEAYRQAYTSKNMQADSINTEAHKLLAHPKIAARVNELRNELAIKHGINIDVLAHELEQARLNALANNSPKAAIDATLGKAKLAGLLTDKVESNQFINSVTPTVIEIVGPDFEDWSEPAKEHYIKEHGGLPSSKNRCS